ncbi:MAG: O-antigen ligase family protein [Candidatus Eisenbacteria bacterium]|uniref:O-antigen ligase family protein n=1 Tax=Eiseniibacteriota bacterium TaxID=2212470 RepID=A0A538TAL5_UNCEI|nr:MAG: O-antigen ligase family protein [Candidatus Eisenbacteria bacterium]
MTYLALVSLAFLAALYSTGLKYVLHNRYALLIPDFAFASILLLLMARELVERRPIRRENIPLFLAVCAYLVTGLLEIGNPNVPSVRAGLEGFRKTCLYISPALVGLYLGWSPNTAKRFIHILALATVPLCLYSVKQFLAPTAFDLQIPEQNTAGEAVYNVFGVYRATSLLGSPFALGFMGNVAVALGFYLAATRTAAPWVWVVICGGVAAIVASLTRVSIVAGLVLAAVAPAMILRAHGWILRSGASIILLALVGMSLSMTPVAGQVARSLDLRYLEEDRAYARFEGYDAGLTELARSPLMGYGAGSAGDGLDSYFSGSVYLPASHNVLLKIGFELGLVGLLAFLLFCISWIRIAIHRYQAAASRSEKALIGLAGCLFIVFIIQGASGSGIDSFPANAITFFIMGLVAGTKGRCTEI